MTETTNQLKTVKACLDYLFDYFERSDLYYGHGTDNAWDEAVALLCGVLGFPPDVSDAVLNDPISGAQSEKIVAIATARVEQRQPLAYLLQQAWFMGLPFYVDERVLIPRSPFAEIIAQQFLPWVATEQVETILEIGTGSGCMSIAAATVFPKAQLVAADISPQALAVAQKNVAQHQLDDRVELIESDVFSHVSGQFDIIMSNPPYVGQSEMQTLPAEYQHEPTLALQAIDQGMAIVDRILLQAAQYLKPDGILVVEVGNTEPVVNQRYPQYPFIWLEFANGGSGVFLITKQQLLEIQKELLS